MSTRAKLGLVFGAVLFALVLAEIAYGVVYYTIRQHRTYYSFRKTVGDGRLYVGDPDIGYRAAPNLRDRYNELLPLPHALRRHGGLFDTNDAGFRYEGTLAVPKPPGGIRIFSFGGSTTFGVGPSKYTYPGRLNAMFSREDPRVKVINAGVGGYRTIHHLKLYPKVIRRYEPDIITMHDGWNDYEDSFEAYWRPRDPHRSALTSQLRVYDNPLAVSALGQLAVRGYYAWKEYDRREFTEMMPEIRRKYFAFARDPRWLDEYEQNLQELIDLAKKDGVVPMLILFPSPHFPNASEEVKRYADEDLNMGGRWDAFVIALEGIRERLHRLADRNKIPLIDANAEFDKLNADYKEKFELFTDRMHLTEEGDKLLAKAMYPCVKATVERVRRLGRAAAHEPLSC